MAELAKKDEPVTRRVLPRDEAVAHFNAMGEAYKAEIIGSHSRRRGRLALSRRRVRGPLPRPARAAHRQARHFKLMKVAGAYWRGDQRNEMLQRIYGTAWATKDELQQLPAHARGGREARPPQARPRARPVPHRRGRAGRRLLASRRAGRSGRRSSSYMRDVYTRHRLPGGQGPADPRQEPVGEDRPLAELPREHVHDRVGEARVRAEADELPRPRADLQVAAAQLQGPADPLRRVRPVPSQRAERRAARDHARARLHPGRRPRLLHRGPDPRRVRRLHRAAAAGLQGLRLHRHHLQGRDAAGKPGRRRRLLGQGRVRAAGGAAPLRLRVRRSPRATAPSTARRSSTR